MMKIGSTASGLGLGQAVSWPVRLLTLALLVGGLVGAVTSFFLIAGFWPWDMPALASRFLASAAVAYMVGSLLSLTRSRWLESEFLITTVLIYGLALVAAVLLDPQVIDWSKPVAWSFVSVISFALVITLAYLWRNRGLARTEANPANALGPSSKIFLAGLGLVAGVVGLIVYFVPKESGFVWPWAVLPVWKPLDTRLIASMLLVIAGGAFMTLWRNDRAVMQVFVGMLLAYGVVAGIGIGLNAASTPAFVTPDVIYIVIFGLILLVAVLLTVRESMARPAHIRP